MGSSGAIYVFSTAVGRTLKFLLRRPLLIIGLLIALTFLISFSLQKNTDKPQSSKAPHQNSATVSPQTTSPSQQTQTSVSNDSSTSSGGPTSGKTSTSISTTTTTNNSASNGNSANESQTTVIVNGKTITPPTNGCVNYDNTSACSQSYTSNDGSSYTNVVSNTNSTNVTNF